MPHQPSPLRHSTPARPPTASTRTSPTQKRISAVPGCAALDDRRRGFQPQRLLRHRFRDPRRHQGRTPANAARSHHPPRPATRPDPVTHAVWGTRRIHPRQQWRRGRWADTGAATFHPCGLPLVMPRGRRGSCRRLPSRSACALRLTLVSSRLHLCSHCKFRHELIPESATSACTPPLPPHFRCSPRTTRAPHGNHRDSHIAPPGWWRRPGCGPVSTPVSSRIEPLARHLVRGPRWSSWPGSGEAERGTECAAVPASAQARPPLLVRVNATGIPCCSRRHACDDGRVRCDVVDGVGGWAGVP